MSYLLFIFLVNFTLLIHSYGVLPFPDTRGQNEKVTEPSDTYYITEDEEVERPIRVLFSGENFLKASRTHTASLLDMPGRINNIDSDETGPIRVLIKDDTDNEPDYISFTNKPYLIKYFDITKATVEDDKTGDPSDDLLIARRTSPFDRLDRVTRTSSYDGLYRVIRPQMSTVYRVLADRRNFQSNEYSDIEPNDVPSNVYNIDSDFYDTDDFSGSPIGFAIKQDSLRETLPWADDEFPVTEGDKSTSSSRTSSRQMTTSTQVSYGKESLSNENDYSSYVLNSTWSAITIRNYFAQLFSTPTRSTARTNSLRSQAAPFKSTFNQTRFISKKIYKVSFAHERSKNGKDVTKQIKYLTKAILYFKSRKTGRPKKHKARRLKEKLKRKKKKQTWECYDCGMNNTEFGQMDCHNIFGDPDDRGSYLKKKHLKKCNGPTRFNGQCFKRYLDVGSNYDERGCRSYPPACGLSYASQKFKSLEYLLDETSSGCVTSPHAVLMPFSRTIQLYVRFHVCVCEGRKCNVATSIVFNWTTSLSIILYFVI